MPRPASEVLTEAEAFWIMATALNLFIAQEGKGFLPVSTDIPDMTCETDTFVRLKLMYGSGLVFAGCVCRV